MITEFNSDHIQEYFQHRRQVLNEFSVFCRKMGKSVMSDLRPSGEHNRLRKEKKVNGCILFTERISGNETAMNQKTICLKTARYHSNQGFTLLEMLVVLVIIGLLAGLVGPRLFTRVDDSKVKAAQVQVKMIKGALETMRLDTGRFPTGEEGLGLLQNPPSDARLKSLWRGPYLDEALPLDPWGSPYQFSVPGANGQPFALYSFGADGKAGGTGIDADVGFLPE